MNVKLPNIGDHLRAHGELVEIQDVTPPVTKVEDWIFKDTSARVDLLVNGKRVKTYCTMNNFYGKDSCVPNAIKEAKDKLMFLQIAGDGEAEIVVVKVTTFTRMRPTGQTSYYMPDNVSEFRPLECGWGANLPEVADEIVWSSKNPQEQPHA